MSIFFRYLIAVSVVSAILLTFQIILYKRWHKRLHQKNFFKYVSYVYGGIVIITQLQLWVLFIVRVQNITISYEGIFYPYYLLYLGWQYPMGIFFLPYLALWGLLSGIEYVVSFCHRYYQKKRRDKRPQKKLETSSEAKENALSINRKDFLFKAAHTTLDSIPFALSAVAISGMFIGSREIVTEKQKIHISGLHPDLEGFRIVQISDTHIGSLINEQYLNFCFNLLSSIKADMLVVTGDIIDNNNYYIPLAARFFKKLSQRYRYGIYGVMGNHDYIDNGQKAAQGLNSAGLRMLKNENVVIRRGRGSFNLLGLDYPNPLARQFGKRIKMSQDYFASARKQIRPGIPTILLNHHPSDFIYLQNEPVDLVLSGHTHGGQIRFSQNRNSILSFQSIAMRYYTGHYQENGSQLYVNRGTGHWMPLRINCPAEISVIELFPDAKSAKNTT